MTDRQPYSPLAKALHWIIAALVLISLPIGVVMADLDKGPLQDNLFVLHESAGLVVLALMLPRLAARLRRQPGMSENLTPTQRLVAKATHRTFYLLLIATPIVGWLALSAYGLGPSFLWLGHLPALTPKDEPLSKQLFEVHEVLGWVVLALIALHIAGVIRHRIAGDDVVWRMLPESWRK